MPRCCKRALSPADLLWSLEMLFLEGTLLLWLLERLSSLLSLSLSSLVVYLQIVSVCYPVTGDILIHW